MAATDGGLGGWQRRRMLFVGLSIGLVVCVIWGFAIRNFLNDVSLASNSPLVCEQNSPGVALSPNAPQALALIRPGRGYRGFQLKAPVVCGLRPADGALGRHLILSGGGQYLEDIFTGIQQVGNLLYLTGPYTICVAGATNGSVNWCQAFYSSSTIQLDQDDHLVLVRTASQLLALAAGNGHQLWSLTANPVDTPTPWIHKYSNLKADQAVVVERGVVYANLFDASASSSQQTQIQGRICALQAQSGQQLWCHALPASMAAARLVSDGNLLYTELAQVATSEIGVNNSTGVQVEAFRERDGTLAWTQALACDEGFTPLLAVGGVVVAPTNTCDGTSFYLPITLEALRSADGKPAWKIPLQFVTTMLTVNGVLYVANQQERFLLPATLLSIDPGTGRVLGKMPLTGLPIHLAASQDTLYIAEGGAMGDENSVTAIRLADGKELWQAGSCDNPTTTALPGDQSSNGAPRRCYWQTSYTALLGIGVVPS